MTQPAISVIVPVYDRADDLRALLADLRAQVGVSFEVIVVDDGSPTPIQELLADETYPYPVTWCRHDSNQGAGTARNTALDAARADLILFIDSDGRVRDPECLRKHHDYQTGKLPIPIAAPAPFVLHGHIDGIHHNYAGKTFYYSNWFMSMGKRWALMRSTHAPTHNTSVPRAVFDRVGKFDPKFCLAEDADWSIRCVKAGIPLVYTPEISVGHHDRDTMASVLHGYRRMGEYSVQVRLKNPASPYGYLFPRSRATALFQLPVLVVLITVFIAWQCLLKSPRGLLYLPGMLLANIAYGAGIWQGLARRHTKRASRGAAPEPDKSRQKWSTQNIAMLLLTMVMAFGLRVYRIDETSVWFDEFNALLHDTNATFTQYMDYVSTLNPDHLPLYFAFIFVWMKYLGGSVLGLRMVSITLGCLTIVPLYAFAGRIYSRKAGHIAGACLAMSPFHIYRHRSVRSHAFVGLMAMLSLYLTLRCASSRHRGLILLHACLNSILIYTHLSTVGLVGLEFFYLAYAWQPAAPSEGVPTTIARRVLRRIPRELVFWAALHVPIALRVLTWFGQINSGSVTWYKFPTFWQWLNDLLGDVMVTLNADFIMTPLFFQLGDTWHRGLDEILSGFALMAFMGAAVIWGIYNLLRSRAAAARRKTDSVKPQVLLLTIALGPVLGLTLVSLLWEPVILPRYTTYASLGLFSLVGGMLASPQFRSARSVATIALVALYAMQLNLLLTHHARSDWKGVGNKLISRAEPNDTVIAMGLFPDGLQTTPRPIDILQYNMPENDMRMIGARSLAGMVDESVRCLADESESAPQHVWLLIEDWLFFPQRIEFERSLMARGLRFQHWRTTNLHLYELTPSSRLVMRDSGGLSTSPEVADYPEQEILLRTFVPRMSGQASPDEAVAALRWAVPALPLREDATAFVLAVFKAMELSPATGRYMAQHAQISTANLNPKGLLCGLACLAEADFQGANSYFSKIDEANVSAFDEHLPGLRALIRGDYHTAKETIAADLRLNPGRIPSFFRYLAGIEPPPCGSRLVPLP